MDDQRAQPRFLTGIALLLPITLTTMAIVLLAPVMPMMMRQFADVPGHDYLVPMILTLPALCVAILCPFAGILGDYFGKRKLLLASFILYAGVGVAPVFLTDLTAILISRVGVGIAEALIYVLSTAMIADHFHGKARDQWLAAQPAFASVSAVIFFNLGGVLGEYGWQAPFWVYGSAILMFVMVWLYTHEAGADSASGEEAAPPRNLSWEGFPWARLAVIVAVTIFGSVFFYTVQIQSSSGLALLGMTSPAQAGFWTSVASLGVPIGTILFARFGPRIGTVRLLVIEFALLATGFLLMGLAHDSNLFLIGCFINQLGAGLLLPTLLVWAMSILPFEVRSRGTGFWQSAFALGQWLSPLVVTYLALGYGGLPGSFQILSALAGIGAVAAVVASRLAPAGPVHNG